MDNLKLISLSLILFFSLNLRGYANHSSVSDKDAHMGMVTESMDVMLIADAGPDQTLNCLTDEVSIGSDNTSTGPNISYEWTAQSGSYSSDVQFPKVTDANNYFLKVTDTNTGEMAFDTVRVDISQGSANVTISSSGDLTCENDTGILTGSVASNNPNLVYEWFRNTGSFISAGPILEINFCNSYTLVVSNPANGCSASSTIFVNCDFVGPRVNIDPFALFLPGGSVQLNASNSSTGNNFVTEWTSDDGQIVSGQNTLTPTVDQEGTYCLTITNTETGCSNRECIVASVSSTTTVFADAGPDQFFDCSTMGTITIGGENTSMGAEFVYEWRVGSEVVSNEPFHEADLNTSYRLTVTNTLTNEVAMDNVQVGTSFTFIGIGIGSSGDLSCDNPSINLAALSEGLYFIETSILWTTPDGSIISDPTQNIITVNQPGTYTVVATEVESGCTGTESFFVASDGELPDVFIETPQPLPPGGSIQLAASTNSFNTTLQWSSDDGQIVSGETFLTPTVNAAGTYCLIVTNQESGCSSQACVDVIGTMNATVVADAGPDQMLDCSTVAISDVGGQNTSMGPEFTYAWTDAAGTVIGTTAFITISEPGQYTLTVTNETTGEVASDQVSFSQDIEIPSIAIAEPSFLSCTSSTVIIDADASSTGELSFEWTNSSGAFISDAEDITVEEPGTYSLTVFNLSNGCFTSESVEVLEDDNIPTLVVDIQQIVSCEDFVTLDPSLHINLDATYTYAWQEQDGLSVDPDAPIIAIISMEGTYTLVQTDALTGCLQHLLFTAIPNGGVFADAGPDMEFSCGNIDASIGGPNSTMGKNITYRWSTMDGDIFGPTNLPTAIPIAAGTYILEVTDMATACVDIDEVVVDVPSLPDVNISMGTINCFDATVTVDASASAGGSDLSYLWTNNAGEVISTEPIVVLDLCESYNLQVNNNVTGCFVETSIMTECSLPLTVMLVMTSDGNILAEVSGGTAPYTYTWNVGVDGPIIENPENGVTYAVEVADANGCVQSMEILFETTAVDRSSAKQLSLYPNPTKDIVTIELENISGTINQLKIIDMQGRSMEYKSLFTDQHTLQLSLDALMPGTYIIHAIIDEQLFYQKLIVIK